MIVLIDGVRYGLVRPENEAWLERQVEANYQHIFGAEAFYFPKRKMTSKAGIGTIPDAFAIYFDRGPKWAVIELELASHPVYERVFPELTKFKRALGDATSRRKIVEFFYDAVKADAVLEARIKEQIGSGELYEFLADLVAEQPTIAVIIDEQKEELGEALRDFGREVRVVEFRTYRREGVCDEINAYCFEPIVSEKRAAITVQPVDGSKGQPTRTGSGGIGGAVYALFDEKDVDQVTYEECERTARRIRCPHCEAIQDAPEDADSEETVCNACGGTVALGRYAPEVQEEIEECTHNAEKSLSRNDNQSDETGPNAVYWIFGGLILTAGLFCLARGKEIGAFLIAIVVMRAFVYLASGK